MKQDYIKRVCFVEMVNYCPINTSIVLLEENPWQKHGGILTFCYSTGVPSKLILQTHFDTKQSDAGIAEANQNPHFNSPSGEALPLHRKGSRMRKRK